LAGLSAQDERSNSRRVLQCTKPSVGQVNIALRNVEGLIDTLELRGKIGPESLEILSQTREALRAALGFWPTRGGVDPEENALGFSLGREFHSGVLIFPGPNFLQAGISGGIS
jgi:hypothetical protein